MYCTISTRYRHYMRQERNHACIELPNGMKCNVEFFWWAVEMGILNEDD